MLLIHRGVGTADGSRCSVESGGLTFRCIPVIVRYGSVVAVVVLVMMGSCVRIRGENWRARVTAVRNFCKADYGRCSPWRWL